MSNFVMLRRLDDTSGSVRTTLRRQPGVARASAAGPASKISQLMNTAPVCDTVPDASSSAAEPVTSVEHMTTMTTTMIGRQARCCNLTLRTFWSRLNPLRSMPPSQTRTRSLIFRRCALVQNAQSRMRTTIIRSTTLKRRRSANVFNLPQIRTRTTLHWMTRATRLIGINCRTKSLSPR
jgi:hypothetical protein